MFSIATGLDINYSGRFALGHGMFLFGSKPI